MTAKLLSTSLLAIVILSSSCTDSPSVAGEYLSKNKYSSGSKDASPEDGADQGEGGEGGDSSTGDETGSTDPEGDTGEGEGDGTEPVVKDPVVKDPVVEKPADMTPPDMTKPDPVKPDPVKPDPVKPAAPVFADVKANLFEKYSCVNCHGATLTKGNVKLETYAQVKQNIEKVKVALITEKSMPPGGTDPEQADIDQLKAWIAAGMPEK